MHQTYTPSTRHIGHTPISNGCDAFNFNVYLNTILASSATTKIDSSHCSTSARNDFQMQCFPVEFKCFNKRQRNKLECVLNYKITPMHRYICISILNERIDTLTSVKRLDRNRAREKARARARTCTPTALPLSCSVHIFPMFSFNSFLRHCIFEVLFNRCCMCVLLLLPCNERHFIRVYFFFLS